MRQLKQRVSAICRLQPLTIEELRDYIRHRLSLAGLPEQRLFSEEIIDLIFRYTQGIPRLVNSLCDGALQTGFALQSPRITADIIREVAGDLELSDAGAALARKAAAGAHPEAAAHPDAVAHPEAKPIHPEVRPIHSEVKTVPVVKPAAVVVAEPPPPVTRPSNGVNGKGKGDARIPLEGYSSRQKGLGFFGQLLDRWR